MKHEVQCATDDNGVSTWFYTRGGHGSHHHRVPHRDDDQPAVVHPDGTQEWFQHGARGRVGDVGPAVITNTGTKEWWAEGKFYGRTFAPAACRPQPCSPTCP